MNLYETLTKCLSSNGHTFKELLWIGCTDYEITLENFCKIAKKTPDNEFIGSDNIPTDLLDVGADFWIERVETATNYIWEYKSFPQRPKHIIPVNALSTYRLTDKEYRLIEEIANKYKKDDYYPQMWMLPFLGNNYIK